MSIVDGTRTNGQSDVADVQRLRPNQLGIPTILFMVVAFSAPITAMTGNVPVAVGYGNGWGAPAGFIIATIVLTIFSVGYTVMARYITSASPFYGYIAHGISKPVGMASGLLVMCGYMVIEAALVGIFAAFAKITLADQLGIDLPWHVYAAFMLGLIAILSYFEINFAARVLAVMLVLELSILVLMSFAVLFSGGGPDGVPLEAISPVNAFEGNGVASAAVGLGLFMAFWSWIGFEATAVYGEESRNPRRVIPIATFIAVIGIGVMYTFFSWMAVAGNGLTQSVQLSSGDDPFQLFFAPTREYLGAWGIDVFQWLLLTGSFACGFAVHNTAARYLYTLGREGFIHRALGRTQRKHGSPHVASFAQTGVATTIVLLFALFDEDPYLSLFVLGAIFATMSILIVQTLSSFAVIGYFHVHKRHPENHHILQTLVAPLVGGIAMIAVVYLLVDNLDAAAGAAAETLVFDLIPWIVVGIFVFGFLAALYLRSAKPEAYDRIAWIIYRDTAERDGVGAAETRAAPAVGEMGAGAGPGRAERPLR
jgi:amino acid transporter